jgi:hypothetical protein
LPGQLLGLGILLKDFVLAHAERREMRDLVFGPRVADGFRAELLLDIFPDAHFLNPLDVSGARSKPDPVKDMGDLFLVIGLRGLEYCRRTADGCRQKQQKN